MSLANKYRPKDFDTVIGQEHITGILKAKMKSDKGGNSNFLLFGPRGTGKTSSARILAKAMNCLDAKDGNPCNVCVNCQIINDGKTLDYIEIDAASHTGVDNIREEILDKVPYPPTMLKKKIYVIDEVHMLSKGAFNALLKTIEEPKATVGFILATTEIQKVPETIISRCQVFNFKKVVDQEMVPLLENICKQESLSFEKGALEIISKISEGCVRDAIKYVDQVSILGEISQEHVTKFLGVASDESIRKFLEAIKSGQRDMIFENINNLVQHGVDLQQFAKQMLLFLDSYLHEDTDFYLNVSEAFTDIIGGIRYYPYPAVLYKITLNKYLIGDKTETIETTVKSEKKVITEKPSTIEHKEEAGNDKQTWDKVLSMIDRESMSKSLKDHSSINKIENGTAHITVINKFTQMALEKPENKEYIEKLLSEVLGEKTFLHVHFVNKDDFFEGGL